MLVLAITMHNIPEGLAVGVLFGGVAAGIPEASISGAVALAIGIGIQNFPEGIAVSMPLRRQGQVGLKAFGMDNYQQLLNQLLPFSVRLQLLLHLFYLMHLHLQLEL